MQRLLLPFMFVLGVLSLGLSGCVKDECDAERIYQRFDPVYVSAANLRAEVKAEGPRFLENPGKIYYYQDYLLINEREEGIHIFDNSDPANPQTVSFLPIPGNIDMAVRNGLLYADSWVDLVTFDLSDPQNPAFKGRQEDVFPHFGFDQNRGFIVKYEPTEIREKVSCQDNWEPIRRFDDFIMVDLAFSGAGSPVRSQSANESSTPGGNTTGQGGSLARFTVAKDYLYTVDEFDLHVFSLKDPENPRKINTTNIGWGIETIFPLGDHLFIGSRNGMHIVDIESPEAPRWKSAFWHTTACDPVFVDGDIAYITLRDGTTCDNFVNQLDVVNVSNLENPYLLETYQMHHPIGLSVHDNHLYICEDDQGIKVFDAKVPQDVGQHLINHEKGFTAIDIITLPNESVALIIGDDGLYQFDISDPENLKELSKIPVNN